MGDEVGIGVVGETCEKCGQRMVLNASIGTQDCINRDCSEYDADNVGGLDEEDFDLSGLDWAELGFITCDECGRGFITDGDAAVDLYESDGFNEDGPGENGFVEVRTLCPECRDGLEHDEAGNALDPRQGKTLDEVLAAGGTVGAIVMKDAFPDPEQRRCVECDTPYRGAICPSCHPAPKPVYHATLLLDGSPGGIMLSLDFAEALPFTVEVIGLAGVERQRIDEADENENVTIPAHDSDKPDDPYSDWLWDGDTVAGVTDDSEFAREAWRQHREAQDYLKQRKEA
jgi:hypothetical protein